MNVSVDSLLGNCSGLSLLHLGLLEFQPSRARSLLSSSESGPDLVPNLNEPRDGNKQKRTYRRYNIFLAFLLVIFRLWAIPVENVGALFVRRKYCIENWIRISHGILLFASLDTKLHRFPPTIDVSTQIFPDKQSGNV